ncbi:hypothetical protein HAX54_035044 [Datura stramonium]|uniref:Uncharacterized protein n=1 Tax=Datura stramonium TaxID=4076 RepID=A0ABS8SET4_DATST|nr:hypothetical protein [Datura stramonium]
MAAIETNRAKAVAMRRSYVLDLKNNPLKISRLAPFSGFATQCLVPVLGPLLIWIRAAQGPFKGSNLRPKGILSIPPPSHQAWDPVHPTIMLGGASRRALSKL